MSREGTLEQFFLGRRALELPVLDASWLVYPPEFHDIRNIKSFGNSFLMSYELPVSTRKSFHKKNIGEVLKR